MRTFCALGAITVILGSCHGLFIPTSTPRTLASARTRFCGSMRVNRDSTTRLQLRNEEYEAKEKTQSSERGSSLKSALLLNAVAVIFGSQHAVIKGSLDLFPSTSLLNFWRFLSSALLFSPALLNLMASLAATGRDEGIKDSGEGGQEIWRAGAELGLWTFLGFAFQAVGMETTTASKSAFLLYLNVKFVPFFASVLFGRQISVSTWTSAALALFGTFLLGNDGSGWVIGDLWSVVAAAASALYILRLESFSVVFDAAQLNAVSFAVTAGLCGLWVLLDSFRVDIGIARVGGVVVGLEDAWSSLLAAPLPVLYLGVITTALCNYLQTLGQRGVRAERAAVIYSLDPVYGAVFSYWLLGEELGPAGFGGAALILAGVALSAKSTA